MRELEHVLHAHAWCVARRDLFDPTDANTFLLMHEIPPSVPDPGT